MDMLSLDCGQGITVEDDHPIWSDDSHDGTWMDSYSEEKCRKERVRMLHSQGVPQMVVVIMAESGSGTTQRTQGTGTKREDTV